MEKFKAAVLCAWGFGTAGIYTLAVFGPIVFLALFSRSGRASYAVGKLWARLILITNRVRLEITGLEKIDPGRSYVFIANHASHLDPPAIAVAIPNTLRFIGKASLSRIPLFGLAARRAGVIFIDRGDSHKTVAALNQAIAALTGGVSTLFFAEGTRSPDGRLLPFKKGGVMLALQACLPIVPVTVTGSHALFPKKQRYIKPGTMYIEIGDPIDSSRFTPADRDRLLQSVRGVIQDNLNRQGPIDPLSVPGLSRRRPASSASRPF